MISNDSTKNSTKLHKIKLAIGSYLLRKRQKNQLEHYLETKKVKDFKHKVETALIAQFSQMKPALKEAFETVAKISATDQAKIRAVIDKEYGSFDSFLSAAELTDYMTEVYNDVGDQQMKNFGIDVAFELKNPKVLANLKDRSQFVIDSVDETNKDTLVNLISQGVDNNLSWNQIARQITAAGVTDQEGNSITGYRSELIAREESANAYRNAQNDFFQQSGIQTHYWQLDSSHDSADCDGTCDDNADMGDIPMDEDFEDTHINCKCCEDTHDELPVDQAWDGS